MLTHSLKEKWVFVAREGSLQRLALLQWWWWGKRSNPSTAKESFRKQTIHSFKSGILQLRKKDLSDRRWSGRSSAVVNACSHYTWQKYHYSKTLWKPFSELWECLQFNTVSWLLKGLCKVGSHETDILHEWSEGGFCSWSDRLPSGRPAASVNENNSKHIDDLITADRRMIIQLSRDTACSLMQSLGYSKISEKHILKMLMNTMKK